MIDLGGVLGEVSVSLAPLMLGPPKYSAEIIALKSKRWLMAAGGGKQNLFELSRRRADGG